MLALFKLMNAYDLFHLTLTGRVGFQKLQNSFDCGTTNKCPNSFFPDVNKKHKKNVLEPGIESSDHKGWTTSDYAAYSGIDWLKSISPFVVQKSCQVSSVKLLTYSGMRTQTRQIFEVDQTRHFHYSKHPKKKIFFRLFGEEELNFYHSTNHLTSKNQKEKIQKATRKDSSEKTRSMFCIQFSSQNL